MADVLDRGKREDLFHRAMVGVYERARDEAGYNATRFLQMVSERGGLETARQLLHALTVSDGFTALWEKSRLDLAMEFQVLQPQFYELFSEEEREIARESLERRVADLERRYDLLLRGLRKTASGAKTR